MIPAFAGSAALSFDPLQADTPLPLESEFFPMGYPVHIATNSAHLLVAARRIWSPYPRLSDHSPLRIRVVVTPASSTSPPPAPVYRGREHLITAVASADTFAAADLRSGFAFATATRAWRADELTYHLLEPLAYSLIGAKHVTFAHASCVSLNGRTVVLCGDSGAGKTCLAFACARNGWTFLTGDAVAIVRGRDDYRVIGRPYEIRFRQSARALFPELQELTASVRPNGKNDIEAAPQDLGIAWTLEGTASHIVFLDRFASSTRASIEPYSRNEAQAHLEQSIRFGDEIIRREQRETFINFLRLPVARLRYSDVHSAERALRSFVGGA